MNLSRFFQFRLRTLFALMLLLAIGFTFLGFQVHHARIQAGRIQHLQEQGIEVFYDYEFDDDGRLIYDATPDLPSWVIDVLGRDLFYEPVEVVLPYATSEDKMFEILRYWPNVGIAVNEPEDSPHHFRWDDKLKRTVPVQTP